MVRGQCAVGLFLLLQFPFKVIKLAKLAGRVGLSRGVLGVLMGRDMKHGMVSNEVQHRTGKP